MLREIDKRNLLAYAGTEDERRSRFFNLANVTPLNLASGGVSELPEINAWTGNLRGLKTDSPVALPQGSFLERALTYLQAQKESFGFEENKPADFTPDPHVATTSTGKRVVHLQQNYKGIPVFLVNKSVVFNGNGEIEEALGDSVSFTEEVDIEPKVTVLNAAVQAAAAIHANLEDGKDGWGEKSASGFAIEGFAPKKIVEFSHLPARPTVLEKGVFANYIRANLILFYVGPEAVLAWYFTVEVDEGGLQCDVVVSAGDPASVEVLYLKRTSHTALARGNVYKRNGGEPRVWVNFPVDRAGYPIPLNGTTDRFRDWIAADETKGVNVVASIGNMVRSLRGILNGAQFDFDPTTDEDQRVLNMFYFCNFMHDFFYLLGFNEAAGSFEGDDPLFTRAYNAVVTGTANLVPSLDGTSPVMNMGLVASSGLHTALDADVVFHEYVHGVTNRLVGGRLNDRALVEKQSRAMGEGWSDYFALTVQNFDRPVEKYIIGDWVKGGRGKGIRSRPYDDSFNLTYGTLPQLGEEHSRGEIWCAALLHWTRHLSAVAGKEQAYFLCWQAVVDGLKLTNANPNFLEGRDGIRRALTGLKAAGSFPAALVDAAIQQFLLSFAKFGMGAGASSVGPAVDGIRESFATLS